MKSVQAVADSGCLLKNQKLFLQASNTMRQGEWRDNYRIQLR